MTWELETQEFSVLQMSPLEFTSDLGIFFGTKLERYLLVTHFYRLLFSFFTFQLAFLKSYLNLPGRNLEELVIPLLPASEHHEAGGGKEVKRERVRRKKRQAWVPCCGGGQRRGKTNRGVGSKAASACVPGKIQLYFFACAG